MHNIPYPLIITARVEIKETNQIERQDRLSKRCSVENIDMSRVQMCPLVKYIIINAAELQHNKGKKMFVELQVNSSD